MSEAAFTPDHTGSAVYSHKLCILTLVNSPDPFSVLKRSDREAVQRLLLPDSCWQDQWTDRIGLILL